MKETPKKKKPIKEKRAADQIRQVQNNRMNESLASGKVFLIKEKESSLMLVCDGDYLPDTIRQIIRRTSRTKSSEAMDLLKHSILVAQLCNSDGEAFNAMSIGGEGDETVSGFSSAFAVKWVSASEYVTVAMTEYEIRLWKEVDEDAVISYTKSSTSDL